MDVSKTGSKPANEGPKCTTEDSGGWASPPDHSRVPFDTMYPRFGIQHCDILAHWDPTEHSRFDQIYTRGGPEAGVGVGGGNPPGQPRPSPAKPARGAIETRQMEHLKSGPRRATEGCKYKTRATGGWAALLGHCRVLFDTI